jgi:hypothetical protein
VTGEVLDRGRGVCDGRARGEVLADPSRCRDLPAPGGPRHLAVDRRVVSGGERPEDDEQTRAPSKQRALPRVVPPGQEPREDPEAGAHQHEQAREGPQQVSVEVDAHEHVDPGRREHRRDEPQPDSKRDAEPGRGPGRHEQDEDEPERGKRERRVTGREADRGLGGVEPEEQPPDRVDPVSGGDVEARHEPVVGQQRLVRDRRAEPRAGESAHEDEQGEGGGEGGEGKKTLPCESGTRAKEARPSEDEGHDHALGPGQGEGRSRQREAAGLALAPEDEPPVEHEKGEEEEQRDVRPVEEAPDHGAAEGDERAREEPLPRTPEPHAQAMGHCDRRQVEPGPEQDREGDEALSPRARGVADREEGGVEGARRPRGRSLARVVLKGVALGHRPGVLADDVQVGDLRDEVAPRAVQHRPDEAGSHQPAEEQERAHGGILARARRP